MECILAGRRGEQGERGLTGPTGPQGPQGPQGTAPSGTVRTYTKRLTSHTSYTLADNEFAIQTYDRVNMLGAQQVWIPGKKISNGNNTQEYMIFVT